MSAGGSANALQRTQLIRFTEIDGMRGLGASFVILGHLDMRLFFWVWMFMDMFFVISSFLITRIVLRQVTGISGLLAFWGRRIERIWPLYLLTVWLLLLLTLALNTFTNTLSFDVNVFWRFFTFSQFTEYFVADTSSWRYPFYTGHLWSLAVEEQFYILLPTLVLLLRWTPTAVWLAALLLAIPLAVAFRAQHPYTVIITSHIDAFALGSLFAIGLQWMEAHRRLATRVLWLGLAAGLVWFLPYMLRGYTAYLAGLDTPDYEAWPATAGVLLSSCWIALLALYRETGWLAALRWAPLVYTGVISYALYLIHYPVIRMIRLVADHLARTGVMELPRLLVASFSLVICFLLAHWLYKLIDQRLQAGRGSAARGVPVPERSLHP